jgi:transposase
MAPLPAPKKRPPRRQDQARQGDQDHGEETLDSGFLDEDPERLIGDKAYDSDKLDATLKERGIELIAPNRKGRGKTQDGRRLRRYERRWKVERLFAWLGNFRRLVVRYERRALNFLGFVHLGCILILLRALLRQQQ